MNLKSSIAALLIFAGIGGVAHAQSPQELSNAINVSRQNSVQRAIIGEQMDMQREQLEIAAQQVEAQYIAAQADAIYAEAQLTEAQSVRATAETAEGVVGVQLPPSVLMGQGLVGGAPIQINIQNGNGNLAGNTSVVR